MEQSPKVQASTAPSTGFNSLVKTVFLYLDARLRLVQIESKEAGTRILSVFILTVITLGAFALGWLIAIPALIWWIADKYAQPWHLVAFSAAGAHIVLALILVIILKSKIARLRLFEDTVGEFQKDRQWLAQNQP